MSGHPAGWSGSSCLLFAAPSWYPLAAMWQQKGAHSLWLRHPSLFRANKHFTLYTYKATQSYSTLQWLYLLPPSSLYRLRGCTELLPSEVHTQLLCDAAGLGKSQRRWVIPHGQRQQSLGTGKHSSSGRWLCSPEQRAVVNLAAMSKLKWMAVYFGYFNFGLLNTVIALSLIPLCFNTVSVPLNL